MDIKVITSLITACSEALGNFKKLNPVKDHAVVIFWKILGGLAGAVFFYNLFMREDLYQWIISVLTTANLLSFSIVVGIAMFICITFSQQRMFKAAIVAIEHKDKEKEDKHAKSIERRRKVNPQVRAKILSAVCELGAYRGMCAEYHNGKENADGLGFTHFTENYEEINPKFDQHYVADSYENMRTSFYSICDYIHEEGNNCLIGTLEEIREVDPRYAANMEHDGMCFAAICEVENVYNPNRPLGILSIMWREDQEKDIPKLNVIENVLRDCESDVKALLTFKQ